jgi:predicted type IV restriction endonuclease
MKEIIESIRTMLKDGLFRDEQHVRFSLVGRLCFELGWDIWNPAEFHTEYRVKKYPPNEVTVDLRGRVDVALILTEKRSDIAEVFIEIKAPGKLQRELTLGETQLQKYNYWDKSAISILTDGVTWRFYLPSAGGAFESTLFNEIDLEQDDIETVCQVFDQVLRRDHYRKQALQTAEDMYEERRTIDIISKVKNEAERLASDLGDSKHEVAQKLIKNKFKWDVQLSDIERLWERSKKVSQVNIPTYLPRQHALPTQPQRNENTSVVNFEPISPTDYAKQKPKRVFVIGTWYEIGSWAEVKATTYNVLLDKLIGVSLPKTCSISKNKDFFSRTTLKIDKDYYIDINLGSVAIVKHCKQVVKAAGYNPETDWGFELR